MTKKKIQKQAPACTLVPGVAVQHTACQRLSAYIRAHQVGDLGMFLLSLLRTPTSTASVAGAEVVRDQALSELLQRVVGNVHSYISA